MRKSNLLIYYLIFNSIEIKQIKLKLLVLSFQFICSFLL
nr:MAG TPA: hypothetical protein [Bacteriophage sp.]